MSPDLESLIRRIVREELEAHRERHTPVYTPTSNAEEVAYEAMAKKRPPKRWSR